MEYITVALAKGRLGDYAAEIFGKAGYDISCLEDKGRKLIFTDEIGKVKYILVKASDVPCYVEYGAADIGIVGKDTILEEGRSLYEVLNLNFGKCRMCVCGPQSAKEKLQSRVSSLKVATKYPNIARKYFKDVKKQSPDIIKLNGSIELAPIVGLSDVIVDIVESGKTLEENGLGVLEEVCTLSARLIVNKVSMKMKPNVFPMIEALKKDIDEMFDGNSEEVHFDIAYTCTYEAALEMKALLEETFPNCDEIIMDPLSLSISCHVGEGALGIACTKKLDV